MPDRESRPMSGWERIRPPAYLLKIDPGARQWVRPVPDGLLRVLRSSEPVGEAETLLLHLSISHAGPDGPGTGRYPTWDEQKEAVHRFGLGRAYESIILPPNDPSWVNVHPTTFHWWEHRP